MEQFAAMVIPALVGAMLVRMLALPVRLAGRFLLHGGCGFLCLWLLNSVSAFTGVYIPINVVTVLTAGVLGVPGIAGLTLLEILG